MKIKEAIEIKKRQREGYTTFLPEQIDEADRLSIEALKRCQNLKTHTPPGGYMPLPGETEAVQRGMSETKFINPETD